MTHGNTTLRIILAGAITALVAAAPVAHAEQPAGSTAVSVCNQATPTSVGNGDVNVAFDGDSGPAARYQSGLSAKPGNGAGLATAAAHSPALTACGVLTETPVTGGDAS